VLSASLVLFGLTLGLKDNPLVPIGPGFYPRIVLGVTAALSLWLVVADAAGGRSRKPAPALAPDHNYLLVGLMFLLFGLYCGALAFLGYRLSTVLYVAAANALLDPPRGARGWGRVALVAVLTAFLTHLVFERYLTVLLPRGTWTGF